MYKKLKKAFISTICLSLLLGSILTAHADGCYMHCIYIANTYNVYTDLGSSKHKVEVYRVEKCEFCDYTTTSLRETYYEDHSYTNHVDAGHVGNKHFWKHVCACGDYTLESWACDGPPCIMPTSVE